MCILPSVIQCDSELKYVIGNKYLQTPPAWMQVKFYPLNEDAQIYSLTNIFQIMIFGTIVKRYRKLSEKQKVAIST